MSDFLSRDDIKRLFKLVNEELRRDAVQGEIYVLGGAVMCLVYAARASTRDVDGVFRPVDPIRKAALRVADKVGIDENWLNDGVKGFLSKKGSFDSFMELSNLKIMCAQGEYLFAMKCLAMRIGKEFFDLDDIRYLVRNLNIGSYKQALDIINRFYPIERIPQKTLYALEEILED